MERTVRELRAIVFQGRDTGQPVVVVPPGPNPEIEALRTQNADLQAALQTMNGTVEALTADLAAARRDVVDARSQQQAQTERLARLEGQLTAVQQAQAQAAQLAAQGGLDPAAAPADGAPPPPVTPADATAQAQAQSGGTLGGPPTSDATTEYERARALLEAGDNAGAASAFQAYVAKYPRGSRTPEARYWLGESLFLQKNYNDAALAYIDALKGVGKAAWGGDAMVKLGRSFALLNKPAEACAALAEFDRRYPTATPALKRRAAAAKTEAKCKAG